MDFVERRYNRRPVQPAEDKIKGRKGGTWALLQKWRGTPNENSKKKKFKRSRRSSKSAPFRSREFLPEKTI